MANKKNDIPPELISLGILGFLALVLGPQLLKGINGFNINNATSSSPNQSVSGMSPPPKKPGCGACSMGG